MNVKEYFATGFDCEQCKFSEFCKRYLLGSHYSACDYDPFCSSINEDDLFKDVDTYYNELVQAQISYERKKEQQREKEKQKALELKKQKRREYYYKNRSEILEKQRQKRQEIKKQKILNSIDCFTRAMSAVKKMMNN